MKKQVFFLNVDGQKIKCEQYGLIKNFKKMLLFCHGFPGTNRLIKLADSLKTNQYLLIEINYRGDKKSEGKFSFLGSMNDIITAAKYLKNNYNMPLYAMGYSMGGFYVINIIKSNPDMFEKVILLNPVVDAGTLFSNKSLADELWTHARNILSLEEPEYYKEEIKTINNNYNPLDFTYELKTPINIVQSSEDEVLSPKSIKAFYSLLKCNKNYYEILHAKHDLSGGEKELIRAIVDER